MRQVLPGPVLSVCLWWVCFQGSVVGSQVIPLPFQAPLLYLGDLSGFWFGWSPMRMWDSSIKEQTGSLFLVVVWFWCLMEV